MQLKTLFCSSVLLALSACSTTHENVMGVDTEKLLYSAAFPHHTDHSIETPEQIYALNDEMKKFIHGHLIFEADPSVRSRKLLKKLFHRSPDSIRYQNGANLTAMQAFNENTANCLSLTILAYALANEAGLAVNFQEVIIPEYWIREGDYNMLTGHVNLKVVGDRNTAYKVVWGARQTTIDFDPYSVKKHFRKNRISKDRVTAMFYNNKGAQALVRNDYSQAYAYFKKSIEQENNFSPVWGNLGLLYKKVGLTSYAEQAYLAAVSFNGKNYNAWNNLAILENELGKFDEAKKIYRFIHKARMNNPYYHALLGEEAFYNEDYKLAISHYKKAKSMQPKEHEFYFGLSKSFFKLGKYELSEFYLSKAKRYAPFKDMKDKYQYKLNLLSSL